MMLYDWYCIMVIFSPNIIVFRSVKLDLIDLIYCV